MAEKDGDLLIILAWHNTSAFVVSGVVYKVGHTQLFHVGRTEEYTPIGKLNLGVDYPNTKSFRPVEGRSRCKH